MKIFHSFTKRFPSVPFMPPFQGKERGRRSEARPEYEAKVKLKTGSLPSDESSKLKGILSSRVSLLKHGEKTGRRVFLIGNALGAIGCLCVVSFWGAWLASMIDRLLLNDILDVSVGKFFYLAFAGSHLLGIPSTMMTRGHRQLGLYAIYGFWGSCIALMFLTVLIVQIINILAA